MAEARARPRISKEDLRRYFHQRNIQCNESSGQITVDFAVQTLAGRQQYKFRLYIPNGFPVSSDPTLAVVDPPCLVQQNETAILQNSAEFQTLGRTREGFQILSLSYSTTTSNAGVFMHQIFMKATLWANAYEEHLATGVSLAQHIRQCNETENESHSTPVPFWLDAQVKRLAKEKVLLDQFFGADKVKWSHDRRAVDVKIKILQNKDYTLRVYLHHDYPNSCPALAIVSPEELFQVNGEPLPLYSQDFNTLGKKHDCLIICHFGPNEWMDNCNITSVINMKGMVWLHAYEQYLAHPNNASFQECLRELCQCSEQTE